MILNASLYVKFSLLNKKPISTAPRLPPAPTIPATLPTAFLFINGTTAYVAPFDILTNNAKPIIDTTENTSISMLANINIPIASKRMQPPSTSTLPFSPFVRLTLSLKMPPNARAKIFIIPNDAAIKPAASSDRSNLSLKYKAAMLSMVISMPKHAP